tara:strand:+ start:246 stop:464 length:219 start_codon:yes stop_codon:yes gene_type:complete
MIKDFECYTKINIVSINNSRAIVWQKKYDDGEWGQLCTILNPTRELVRKAFIAQENALLIHIFNKKDMINTD